MTIRSRTLHDDLCAFIVISRSVIVRMRNVSDKSCRENRDTHFVFSNFSFSKILPFFEIMRKNMVVPDRTQMIICRMRIACWIPKATNSHSECEKCLFLFNCNSG